MTTTELEQAIQGLFQDIYNKEYIGKMAVEKLSPVGYCVRLGMDRPDRPTVIYAELDDDDFLRMMRRQVKDMRLNLTYFGELKRAYHVPCNPVKASCSCNDQG